jgi:hypothetical protein
VDLFPNTGGQQGDLELLDFLPFVAMNIWFFTLRGGILPFVAIGICFFTLCGGISPFVAMGSRIFALCGHRDENVLFCGAFWVSTLLDMEPPWFSSPTAKST